MSAIAIAATASPSPVRQRLAAALLLAVLWLPTSPPTARAEAPASEAPPNRTAPAAGSPDSAESSPLDPSARLPEGGSATEQWDLTAVLDSGHTIVARFIITNTGPGDRNAVVLGHVIRPDGDAVLFKQGRRRSRWKLSEDRRMLDVSASDLSLRDPLYGLAIYKADVQIALEFAPDVRESTPPDATPPGYALEVLALSAPTVGTLWLPEMSEPLAVRGHMALVHSWMSDSEGDVVHRRIDVHKFGDDRAMYGLDLTTPAGLRTQWILAAEDGKTRVSTTGLDVALAGAIPDLERSDYWVPAEIELSGEEASGSVELRTVLVESDPLRVLPSFVRWVVSLTMKPHRVWAESQIDVTLRARPAETPLRIQGAGVTTLTFLNPLKHR